MSQQVRKTFDAKILSVGKTTDTGGFADDPDEETGVFEAMVSVFGNKDHHGDIVEQGAFTRTLAEWVLKERPLPVVWSHKVSDVESILGKYLEAKEVDEGLYVKGQMDLTHAKSVRVFELMKQGLVSEFSWSGEIREYELIEDEDSWWPALKILDVDLWEAGPCFKGANPDTELLSIKSDGSMAGKLRDIAQDKAGAARLSKTNRDVLQKARDLITGLLDDQGDHATKTSQQAPAEDPDVRAALERF